VAMGGRAETFAGLTGMGDLIATCTSPLSRNRHVGVELGKGRPIDQIIAGMNMVAEGVKSAPTVIALAEKHGLDMPIARDVFDVTQGKRSAQDVFRGLLKSSVGDEAHPG
ncbi:MAG: NAD(P)H-dependent glycerol-3-phosphate dehydrogenase, partial [Sphingopyxis sp.]|nr:NAD(P)H-dependent glycerol-3-phosphate dehydrogenase [Sphingopyxis sp.]